MLVIILWLIFSVIVGSVAKSKGRSGLGFFFASLILSPLIGLIIVLVIQPNNTNVERRAIDSGQVKRCPKCSELVKVEATLCKHCQTQL
ncbi:zinc ribbon domain-containing protein [Vibrio rotiferianus]|nr:hypothetical protein B853_20084 [Vibrio rotiferianus CAIM 577 = LMG 21460]TMX31113.1 zinc ribbon domain-containing protein [Vibrio rotiferianus]TMX43286.1 zinc ribbon domain-containing protein [Vibrio rotiferianus]TMX59798.1 zinc ribbon domain-containing protein [Vibrio rotiferianus]